MTTLAELIQQGFRSVAIDVTGVVIDANSKFAQKSELTGVVDRVSALEQSSIKAESANKLTTARTIGLSGGVSATATSFDGSRNISIPVTGIRESYLAQGGKNFTGGFGPIDAAMVPDLGANRMAFANAAGISVQYSTDAGATQSDYGLTDTQKTAIFALGFGCTVGKASGTTITTDCQLRITITSNLAQIYSVLNKFAIYVSTNGSGGCWCTIDGATKANPSTFVTFANRIGVTGWSGQNIINVSGITTYANNDNQYQILRFTFGITSHNSNNGSYAGLSVLRIMGFGGVGQVTPSNMARYGTIYSYDSDQNVTFPAKITATTFSGSLSGNATSATKATQDGNGAEIVATYMKKQDIVDVCNEVINEG